MSEYRKWEDKNMEGYDDWQDASDHLSIIAHARESEFKMIFHSLLLYVYGPDNGKGNIFTTIAKTYPKSAIELQERWPSHLLVYQVYLFAPSPEKFFDRYNCEHFKLGTKDEKIN